MSGEAVSFPGRPTHAYRLSRSFRFGPTIASAAMSLIRNNVAREDVEIVGGGEAEGRVVVIDDVAVTVARLLEDGYAGADIAVLYRGRTQGARALADLSARGIPLETEDLGMLSRGKGPELALAYLRFAGDDGPFVFEEAWPVVYGPDRYIQKEAFQALARKHGTRGLRAVLRSRADAEELGLSRTAVRAMADLARTLDRMGRCPTAGAALDCLLEDVDVEQQLRERIRSEKEQQVAIATFRAVHELLRGLAVAPGQAASALGRLEPTRGAPPNDRVWVSTIHKAKGLEWSCVVLPELLDGACPAEQRGSVPGTVGEPDGIPQSDWMEQERRIFFVGFTRAIDAVYLQVPKDDPSRFVAELGAARAPRPASAGRRWTPEEDDRVRAGWLAGHTVARLADAMGRSHSGIASRLVRLGLVDTREEARARG